MCKLKLLDLVELDERRKMVPSGLESVLKRGKNELSKGRVVGFFFLARAGRAVQRLALSDEKAARTEPKWFLQRS